MRRSQSLYLGLLLGLAWCLGSPVVASATGPPAREWITAINQRTGSLQLISGWHDEAGVARFDPREYPEFVATPPPPVKSSLPTPSPYPKAGVIQSKIPQIKAGQAWYGGNVGQVVGDAPGKPTKPAVHLTVIGDQWQRSVTEANLKNAPEFRALQAQLGDRLAVQYYPPDDPMVARVGLVDQGKPDVVIQDASGKELKRWHKDPGPASIIQEIRKADPNYTPGRDYPGEVTLSYLACGVIGGVVGLVGLVLLFRSGTKK